MPLHGTHAEGALAGDLGVAAVGRHQAQHIQLARAQRLGCGVERHRPSSIPFRQRQLDQAIQQQDEALVVAHHAVEAEALLERRPRLGQDAEADQALGGAG